MQHLNRFGYRTVLCGIQHEAEEEEVIGYQTVLGDPGRTVKAGGSGFAG